MSIKIWDICPFSSKKELGKCHNEFISLIPKDDYVLIRDPDTMYLHPHQRTWIEEIVEKHGNEWDLLGCMTNRVGVHNQCYGSNFVLHRERDVIFNETDIKQHFLLEKDCRSMGNTISETNLIAGFFMLFKRSLWDKIKFEEGIDFDIKFCNAVKKAGGKIGIMHGIYLWHSYRLTESNPTKYKKHLL